MRRERDRSASHLSGSHCSTAGCSHQPCTVRCPHHSSDHTPACHRSTCAEQQVSTCLQRAPTRPPIFMYINVLTDHSPWDNKQAHVGVDDSFPFLYVFRSAMTCQMLLETPCDGKQTHEGLLCTSASLKNMVSESMVIGPDAVWPCNAVSPW